MTKAVVAAALFLLRVTPRLAHRRPLWHLRALCGVSAAGFPSRPGGAVSDEEGGFAQPKPSLLRAWTESPDFRKWKVKEAEILRDVQPTIDLVKMILHSPKYKDGECLTPEDQLAVVENLLAFHPHSEDKIGQGLSAIMVDQHPEFKATRCLFVIRSDGGWIDFSYQKCLRAYLRSRYPQDAERFIKEHFKRT